MTETLLGSINQTGIAAVPITKPKVTTFSARLRHQVETVEVTAAITVGSTYTVGSLPSDCVLTSLSKVFFDDLGTGGATLDIGDGTYADGLATDIAVDTGAG